MTSASAAVETSKNPKANGAMDDDFVPVVTRRRKYSPAECAAKPLVGILLAHVAMPGKKAWNAFIVKLTAPTLVYDRDEEKAVTAEIGEEIILGESAGLRSLIPLASDVDVLYKVKIAVKGRDKKREGNPWLFEIQRSRVPGKRTAEFRLSNYVQHVTPQVAADEGGDEETPF